MANLWFRKNESVRQLMPTSEPYPLVRLQHEIDQLFENFLGDFNLSPLNKLQVQNRNLMSVPKIDIAQTETSYEITAELAGVNEDDIELNLADGLLTLSGKKHFEGEQRDKHYQLMECGYGSFQRTIPLPKDANENKISANYKNGILKVIVSRSASKKPSGRDIKIELE